RSDLCRLFAGWYAWNLLCTDGWLYDVPGLPGAGSAAYAAGFAKLTQLDLGPLQRIEPLQYLQRTRRRHDRAGRADQPQYRCPVLNRDRSDDRQGGDHLWSGFRLAAEHPAALDAGAWYGKHRPALPGSLRPAGQPRHFRLDLGSLHLPRFLGNADPLHRLHVDQYLPAHHGGAELRPGLLRSGAFVEVPDLCQWSESLQSESAGIGRLS